MSALKNELSKKSEYYISKHRMLELTHFCRQYAEWARAAEDLLTKGPDFVAEKYGKTGGVNDPVSFAVIKREYYLKKKEIVKRTCEEVCEGTGLAYYLLAAVTSGTTYDQMAAKHILPVGRNTFYNYYRKFFWTLDQKI